MKTKTKLVAALMLAAILTLIATCTQAQSTRWYINFPSEVILLADSADAGHSIGAHGSGQIKFRVKEGEVIYCTVLDVATLDSYKLEVHYTGNYYEEFEFRYESVRLD